MNPDVNQPAKPPDLTREAEHPLETRIVSPEDRAAVKAWYLFEIENGFTPAEHTDEKGLEERIDAWQRELRDGNLGIAVGAIDSKVVATTAAVLKNGVEGRALKENEAWAIGTVVDPTRRSKGIGEQMAGKQEEIARTAGKDTIRAAINPGNGPSMRLRMNKLGYVLEGVGGQPDTRIKDNDPKNRMYYYRKDLRLDREQAGDQGVDWVAEVASGRVTMATEPISETSPDRILIDPGNRDLVEQATAFGYRGVFLVRPEDGPVEDLIDKNYIIFVREADRTKE